MAFAPVFREDACARPVVAAFTLPLRRSSMGEDASSSSRGVERPEGTIVGVVL